MMKRFLYTYALSMAWALSSFGQASLSISSASAAAGSTATLNLSATSGNTASAVQWTLATTPDVTSVQFALAPSAASAGKTLSCNGRTCIISGMNQNALPDGVVATVSLSVSPSASTVT